MPVNYWEIISDNLSKADWNCGCVSAAHSNGRAFFIAYAYRDGKRFAARADEKLKALIELESAIGADRSKTRARGRRAVAV